ncbi:MAG TPA: DsrE family protein [Gammaproteobacteria bacterium]|nr:DsrE family protein [Gammaproteobacteria bacterium]
MPSTHRSFHALLLALLLGLAAFGARAADDAAALKGLETGKGVFLVDIGSPKKLALYLDVIQGSHRGMERQGVEPDFIVVYIGPSVRFLTSEPDDLLEMEHGERLKAIADSVAALDRLGVRQEVCDVATDVFGIDNATLLPQTELVGDGFISLIGYQSQGYHLVPVY